MIKIKLLFFLGFILLLSAGCSSRKEETSSAKCRTAPLENNISACPDNNTSPHSKILEHTMILKGINEATHEALVETDRFMFNDVKAPVLLVNFFSTWCPTCRGEIPYFEDLQKKYKNELFIAGILVNDDANTTKLKTFADTYHAHYFISNDPKNRYVTAKVRAALNLDENFTLPLTVLYRYGKYYTHYEGAVPVEMIDHDIRTALGLKE